MAKYRKGTIEWVRISSDAVVGAGILARRGQVVLLDRFGEVAEGLLKLGAVEPVELNELSVDERPRIFLS